MAVAIFVCGAVASHHAHAQGSAPQPGAVAQTPGRINERLARPTAEQLVNAFADSGVRNLVQNARKARTLQESLLVSYDARGHNRLSMDVSLGQAGRERVAYRREGVARMRWHRDAGAHIEVEGARAAVPVLDRAELQEDVFGEARSMAGRFPFPYVPGRELVWFDEVLGSDTDMLGLEGAEVQIVHPLSTGAEAGYLYSRGDSAMYTLPDGKEIRLRELIVTPRAPKWYLIVGSFWFDLATHRVVRASYRPSVALEYMELLSPTEKEEIPIWIRPFLNPMRGTIQSVTVESALFEGQFWLPRLHTLTATIHAGPFRIPVEFEQRYEYLSVNGDYAFPAVATIPRYALLDSLIALQRLVAATGDSTLRSRAREMSGRLSVETRAWNARLAELNVRVRQGDAAAVVTIDSLRRLGLVPGCASDGNYYSTVTRFGSGVRTRLTRSCNDSLLVNSPQFTAPLLSGRSQTAGEKETETLRSLLRMGLQAQIAPQLPRIRVGFGDGLLRYNRIEGLSPALGVRQEVGAGYAVDALGRIGTADGEFSGEFQVIRTNGKLAYRLGAYRRLVASNDWGSPLGMGASLQTLLFGRDEGFYYRSRGVELGVASGSAFDWRVFAERHRDARVEAEFSVAKSFNGVRFRDNIDATEGGVFGAAFRFQRMYGEDPKRLRANVHLSAENGLGDFTFGRAMADVTVSRGVLGIASGALTIAAGSSLGELPVQRRFQLGGTHSIRGQSAGAASGDAFWMARAELGTITTYAKPVVFVDAGWAGGRAAWSRPGRVLSGAGVGGSFFDGMIRFDLARGLYPSDRWRFHAYFESRF